MGMDSDVILGVSPLHGLFVLLQSDLQCPFGLAYVSFVTQAKCTSAFKLIISTVVLSM